MKFCRRNSPKSQTSAPDENDLTGKIIVSLLVLCIFAYSVVNGDEDYTGVENNDIGDYR